MKCCHILQVRAGAEPRNLTVGDPAVVEVGPAMFSIPQVSQLSLRSIGNPSLSIRQAAFFFHDSPTKQNKKKKNKYDISVCGPKKLCR